MKIIIENTQEFVELRNDVGVSIPARVWRGETDDGVPLVAFVLAVSPQTHDPQVLARFGFELEDTGRAQQAPHGDA